MMLNLIALTLLLAVGATAHECESGGACTEGPGKKSRCVDPRDWIDKNKHESGWWMTFPRSVKQSHTFFQKKKPALCRPFKPFYAHLFRFSPFFCLWPDYSSVTCGSVVKLRHIPTNFRLHSHEVSYGNRYCASDVPLCIAREPRTLRCVWRSLLLFSFFDLTSHSRCAAASTNVFGAAAVVNSR